jgi:signal peptidase I
MLPQLQLQDKVVVSRLAYRLHSPHRGDIVVFDAPANACPENAPSPGGSELRRALRSVGQWLGLTARKDVFIKRVIGLPGDTVEGHDGHVFIDGRLLLEPYLPPATEIIPFAATRISSGRLWVMGDNRNNSCDSRIFGAIRERSVLGRAFLRVWPLSHVAFL